MTTGVSRGRPWEEVGPFTLDVAREATQKKTTASPTQWSGRLTAMVADPKCDLHQCRLYVGAAGGGVWRTDNALSRNPHWKALDKGLDTTSIGALLIDPTDKSGHTNTTSVPASPAARATARPVSASTSPPTAASTGSSFRAATQSRRTQGIGEIAVDPKNPRHIFMGTTVARHAGSRRLRWALHAARRSDDRAVRVHGRRRQLPAALQSAAGSC